MTFPERLKKVIDKSGLKRDEFYERVEVSKSQLFNYLGGRSEPTISFFQRLKSEFPWVDLEWLVAGEAEPHSEGIDYTRGSGESFAVCERRHDYKSDTASEIIHIINDLDDDARRDVLRYVQERKLLAELGKKRGKKR